MSLKQFIISSCVLLLTLNQTVQAGTATFMTVADIHFDPFTACGNSTDCPMIQKLENTPAAAWQPILAANATSAPYYKQDTNYVLLESTLQALQSTALKTHPQFIIVLGDLLAHRYQEKYQKFSTNKTSAGYQEFVKKTMTFLAEELKNKFPDTDVYITLGNNDSYSGDNVFEANGAFFHDMSALWGQQILNQANRTQMQQDFPTAGYYALDIPQQPALRLIVLNSNLFSPAAKLVPDDTVAREFDWFEQQLQQARLHHQHVLIAMHIPIGIDVFASLKHIPFKILEMWQPQYTKRYADDLEKYSANITGVLSGHLHSDYFQVIETKSGKIPIISTQSISPVNGNNPGFKIFTYNTESLLLQDYTTFYAELATLHWQQEYNFSAIYQMGNADRTLVDGCAQLTADGELAKAYQLYYDTSSNTDPIHYSYNPYYWCQLKAITATDYQTCMTSQ